MYQYLVIAEFSEKRLGFIVGVYDNEAKAKSLVNHVRDVLSVYSLNSPEEIPAFYFDNYQSYRNITGDEYFLGCQRYTQRLILTNGDLSVRVIKCREAFNLEEFIGYRNMIKCYGISMT